ncbi:MAG: hypothetical protein IJZ35_05750 [Clostridia bacterium]|nr:hypothetical protein [Clostridia bacterium]
MGPKPSVNIIFENLGDELCYGTLLSKNKSTGPASVYDGETDYAVHSGNYDWAVLDYDEWKAFVDYEDADGYYFLQEGWQINETKALSWTYYPPNSFKILLYFPESGTFVTSGIYETYAFDSYFTVDVSDMSHILVAEKSYDYTWELISLAVRIVFTIILEIGIGILFGFRNRKHLLIISGVNITTQIILNVLLNIINYSSGSMAFTAYYILFEIIVFAIEAVIFSYSLHRVTDKQIKKYVPAVYALIANALSFGTGLLIAHIIPGIF